MNLAMIPNQLLAKIRDEIFSKDDLKLYVECFINALELDDYYSGIIHEIVHIYQNACFHEESFPIYEIYKQEFHLTETIDDETYNAYYKDFIFEREAETIALENILVIIRRFVPNANIFYYFIELLKETIIRGYEYRDNVFYSPIKVIYQDLFKEEAPEIIIPDVYDSLKIGTDISIRQYKLFKKNYQRIIINKNDLQVKYN